MARQVFFDPFGNYTRGFDTGATQQQNVEANVRRARAQDYDFNTLQPLRTRAMQREDTVGTAALPFREQMLPIGLESARANLYGVRYGQARQGAIDTGMPAPLQSLFYQHYGIVPHQTPQGTVFSMPDQQGNLVPVQTVPHPYQQVLDNLNFERELAVQQMRDKQAYNQQMLNYYGLLGGARTTEADAGQYRATHPQNSMFNVMDFYGGPQAQQPTPQAGFPASASSNDISAFGIQ